MSRSFAFASRDYSNLRMYHYERADIVSDQYDDWRMKNAYLMGWMTFHGAEFIETLAQYPPSQAPASFTIDQIEKDAKRQGDGCEAAGWQVGAGQFRTRWRIRLKKR
jgi:hypothetical protein